MKQIGQTAFFLISIFFVFIGSINTLATAQSNYLDLFLEEHLIEEEQLVSSFLFNIQEVDVEISGGNPDDQLVTQTKSRLKKHITLEFIKEAIFSSAQKDIRNAKVALYLRFQALKIPS